MELIEDDLGCRKMLDRSLQIGWAHVHSNGLDLSRITSMFAQCLSKGAERFGTAPFDHHQQPPPVAIQHVWDVTVSYPGPALVNSYPPHPPPLPPPLPFPALLRHHPPQPSTTP